MADEYPHEAFPIGLPIPPEAANRVKVYRLRGNIWEDLGTGMCGGFYENYEAGIHVIPELNPPAEDDELNPDASPLEAASQDEPQKTEPEEAPRLAASAGSGDTAGSGDSAGSEGPEGATGPHSSEDEAAARDPSAPLLEKKVASIRSQKQGDTFIVVDEDNQVPMTLSFETTEGCETIWNFLEKCKSTLSQDSSDSANSTPLCSQTALPDPRLGNLKEIESLLRATIGSHQGRYDLIEAVINSGYVAKLVPLLEAAEEARSLADLRHLCGIMKVLIFLNDTVIIEQIIKDENIYGVLGALEYDPEFQHCKATHRDYIQSHTVFKEVVPFGGDNIPGRIRAVYRLQYLKDVALARVLDGISFSVFTTLIFFNQVTILEFLQQDTEYLKELFSIFVEEEDTAKQRDGLRLLQQCCVLTKSQQIASRTDLFISMITCGLFQVILFSLQNEDSEMRLLASDLLLTLLEQEPALIQSKLFQFDVKTANALTGTIVRLLRLEQDVGARSQICKMIKLIFHPDPVAAEDQDNGISPPVDPEVQFYRDIFKAALQKATQDLFAPLMDMKEDEHLTMDRNVTSLYIQLLDLLCFCVKDHLPRTSYILLVDDFSVKVGRLLKSPCKQVRLGALRFFKTCIERPDACFAEPLLMPGVIDHLFELVYKTMPRNSLLNSACLNIFETILDLSIPPLVIHLVNNYKRELEGITYVDLFWAFFRKYDKLIVIAQESLKKEAKAVTPSSQSEVTDSPTVRRVRPRADSQRTADMQEGGSPPLSIADIASQSLSDDEELRSEALPFTEEVMSRSSLASLAKRLVDYPDDDDDDDDDAGDVEEAEELAGQTTESSAMATYTAAKGTLPSSPAAPKGLSDKSSPQQPSSASPPCSPDTLPVKRKLEFDEDDEDEEPLFQKMPTSKGSSCNGSVKANQLRRLSLSATSPRHRNRVDTGSDSPRKEEGMSD